MFAVIYLPNFRLQAVLRFRDDRGPVGLVDERLPKAGLLEINAAAAQAGVTTGQTSPQALARCAGLTLLPCSAAQEQATQAALLEIALSVSPWTEATAGGVCTVNLQGARTRAWQALGESVVAGLASLRLRARVGVGSNPDLAFLAARRARPVLAVDSPSGFLTQLKLSELDPSPRLLGVLRDWGIQDLTQLTALPRGDLMDRLGPEAAQLWDRAAGLTERPLRMAQTPEEFCEAFDFEREIDTVEPILFLLRRFLEQLALRLAGVYRVAGQMTLTLTLANGSAHERAFTIPSPTTDVDVLFRILHTHLEGLRLDHGATALRLRVNPTRGERQQFQLFETTLRDPNRFGETLGRLAALVGTENVGVVEVLDTHRPDCIRLNPPRFHERSEQPAAAAAENLAVGMPLRRYRPAIPAQVRMEKHCPAGLQSGRVSGSISASLGPYRLSGGWWEASRWSTEEWDVEMAGGGLYRLALVDGQWFLEGSYDEQAPSGHQWPAQERKIVAFAPVESAA